MKPNMAYGRVLYQIPATDARGFLKKICPGAESMHCNF